MFEFHVTKHNVVNLDNERMIDVIYTAIESMKRRIKLPVQLQKRQIWSRSLFSHKSPQSRRRLVVARSEDDQYLRLRSEAEAPFRLTRLILYGATLAGGFLGLLINTSQIIGAALERPGAPSLTEALKNVAIDIGGLALFGYLFYIDWQARNKQMRRLTREAALGKLKFATVENKILRVADLRGIARIVVVAGTNEQIQQTLEQAETYRQQLSESGVFIIQVPIAGDGSLETNTSSPDDKRWKGVAVYLNEWKGWFEEQMTDSEAKLDSGLYVGLRMDGRVRASGIGIPPWFRFANELPPLEGIWKGFGDGFDGPV